MGKVVPMKKKKLTYNQANDKLLKFQFDLFKDTKEKDHTSLAFNGISTFLFLLSNSGICVHAMKDILNDSFDKYIDFEQETLKKAKKQKAIK
tara:strand:- start:97 stop:372 length:276 start_codon:yes stop_codon:yes gene_type:complete